MPKDNYEYEFKGGEVFTGIASQYGKQKTHEAYVQEVTTDASNLEKFIANIFSASLSVIFQTSRWMICRFKTI